SSIGQVPGAAGATVGGSQSSGGGSASASGGSVAGGERANVTSKFIAAGGSVITSKYIYVGVGYSSQSAAADRALGAGAAAPSYDTRNVYKAVLDYANKHGGFAGRLVKPLYYNFNLTDDINSQLQAACAYWTQDHKVFVLGGGYDIIDACGEKAHTVNIGPGATAETFRKYPHLIDPIGIRFDRLGQVTVVGLHKAGYFSRKLGLVTWADPNYRASLTLGYIATLPRSHLTPAQL